MAQIIENIASIVANPKFLHFIVPLIGVFVPVALKMANRNDKFEMVHPEDFAVGVDLIVAALILYVTEGVDLARKFINQSTATPLSELDNAKILSFPWLLVAFLLGLFALSVFVRKKGWDSKGEITIGGGIVLPNIVGFAMLFVVMNLIG